MDVDEFLKGFLDRLEEKLQNNKKLISRTFKGNFSNQLIPMGCPHKRERPEPYFAISLEVKNKASIQESLATFIEGEMLEGDNQYMCETCKKKYPTLKRTTIKSLPNTLILVLKRFEFNYQTMSKNKINDYCEFPRELNMKKYTEAFIQNEELKKKNKEDL